MSEDAADGLLEARTPGGGVQEAGDGGDMVAGSADLLPLDMLGAAAELVARERRARGRPAGATNRKSADLVKYLQQLGHRDPAVTLSMIQTADTLALADRLGGVVRDARGTVIRGEPVDALAVLAVQQQAANNLMPYLHAKQAVQVELPLDAGRPLMVIGEMTVAIGEGGAFMTAGVLPDEGGEKLNEIKGDACGMGDAMPHGAQAIEIVDAADD